MPVTAARTPVLAGDLGRRLDPGQAVVPRHDGAIADHSENQERGFQRPRGSAVKPRLLE